MTTTSTNVQKPKTRVTDKADPILDEKARQQILAARVALVLRHGFFGNLAMRLKLVNADTWLETAATDGRHFYYNSKFINMLDTGQMMFLFCHELLHCAYDHIGRTRKDHNRKVANIAMDYVVNADCINNGLGKKITVVPVLYDRKYEGWTWEAVYDDLIKNVKEVTLDELAEMLLDDHMDGDDSDGDGDGDQDGKGKGRPRLSDAERQAIKDEFKEALLSAAQASGAGNIPGGLKRLLKDLKDRAADTAEYKKFWEAFGAVFKEGLYEDFERKEDLLELARFKSTASLLVGEGSEALRRLGGFGGGPVRVHAPAWEDSRGHRLGRKSCA